ncbi:MAG TPA: peptidylprolyl isomerase, partial [Candidatus Babeliaceae bacterium]|nr:peptidylprolyl isomerase [Candidatus Babeliaceae bacterium]
TSLSTEKKPEVDKSDRKRPAIDEKESEKTKRFKLDEGVAIVYGSERKSLICASQLGRMGLDGKKRTLDDLIFEELNFQEAMKFKVPCDDQMVDKYISDMRRKHNLSMDDIKQIFRASGYSYEDGREALRKMNVSAMMIEHKIKARMFVALSEVEQYYNEHPVFKETKYELQTVFIPYAGKSKDQLLTQIEQFKQIGTCDLAIEWSSPFWLKESEIADFITKLEPGLISEPQEMKNGLELYKLVRKKDRRLVSFNKRHREITDILRKPKFEKMMAQYESELRNGASIVYLQEGLAIGTTSPLSIED